MKTIAKTRMKVKMLAVLLAVFSVIVLLCAMPRASVSAYIVDSDLMEDSIDPNHECTELCYTDIFYISDDRASEPYVTGFLSYTVEKYSKYHTVFNQFYYVKMYDERSRMAFENEIGGFEGITNALVIYEQRNRFNKQVMLLPDSERQWQIKELEERFAMMKAANCKIMYICGTDEEFFCDYDNNAFLDYVDIHVNIDMFAYFIDTFFQILYENNCKHTIIVDKSLSENCRTDYTIKWVGDVIEYYNTSDFCGYVLPMYLRMLYGIEFKDASTISEVLREADIDVLCHVGKGLFYNMKDKGEYCIYSGTDLIGLFGYDRICYIGTTWWNDDYCELNWLLSDIKALDVNFDSYLFIENGTYRPYLIDEEDLFIFDYEWGLDRYEMMDYLSYRMYDFIIGNDLTKYDNWGGRCIVTSKPITHGGGWVRSTLSFAAHSVYDVTGAEDYLEKYFGNIWAVV